MLMARKPTLFRFQDKLDVVPRRQHRVGVIVFE